MYYLSEDMFGRSGVEDSSNESLKYGLRLVTPASQVGSELAGKYQVIELIGSGGTSSVFEGYDSQAERKVAIKALHAHLVDNQVVVERFEREARTAASIAHPNVVRIFDQTKTEFGQPLLIMEFVEGKLLQELMISCGGSLPVERAVNIFLQIAAALAVAHEKGIVHRDLKPQNIMVDVSNQDHLKVLDFGIAKTLAPQGDTFFKLTQSGETLGSLLYMSPEQCLDEDVDERSDIYSLGCLMYEVLLGKPPLAGRTAFETMNAQISQTPASFKIARPDKQISATLESIIFKSLEKRPGNRFQSVQDLINELQAAKSGHSCAVKAKLEVTELAEVNKDSLLQPENAPQKIETLPSLKFARELHNTIRLDSERLAQFKTIKLVSGVISLLSAMCLFGSLHGLYPAGRELVSALANGLFFVFSTAAFFLFKFLSRLQAVRLESIEKSVQRLGSLDAIEELPQVSTNRKTRFSIEFSIKHKRGHDVVYKARIMPLSKQSEKIWRDIASSSQFASREVENQSILPPGIAVFFDESTNTPIACSTHGAYATILSSSTPEIKVPIDL